MKELSLAIRHNDDLAFAVFDDAGYITHWRIGPPISSTGEDIPFNKVFFVYVNEDAEKVVLEIVDEFSLDEKDKDQTVNLANDRAFTREAEELLTMFMEDNGLMPEIGCAYLH